MPLWRPPGNVGKRGARRSPQPPVMSVRTPAPPVNNRPIHTYRSSYSGWSCEDGQAALNLAAFRVSYYRFCGPGPLGGADGMASRSLRPFTVLPRLPERLQALNKLAYNMWWCWNHEAVALFRRIDADLFEKVDHSPVKLLGAIDQSRLDQLLEDPAFLAHSARLPHAFLSYITAPT